MRALAITALAAIALTTANAAADDKSLTASGAGSAPLSTLGSGSVPAPPRGKAPASIPGGEKVPGFFVTQPVSFNKRPQGYVMVLSKAEDAKDMAKGTFRGESPANGDACFTEQNGRFHGVLQSDADDPEAGIWSSDLRAAVTLGNTVERGERPSVVAVHSERIVTNGAAISLETADAWIDPLTRGARLIAKSSLPLTLVGSYGGAAEQKVYAGRDGDFVHVVLVRKLQSELERRASNEALFATSHENIGSSACDHIRTTLHVAKGQAETASIVSTVQLPKAEEKKTDAPAPAPGSADSRKQLIAQLQDLRSRPIHISPSVSWPSREREALLTVSAGWDSRERNGFGGF